MGAGLSQPPLRLDARERAPVAALDQAPEHRVELGGGAAESIQARLGGGSGAPIRGVEELDPLDCAPEEPLRRAAAERVGVPDEPLDEAHTRGIEAARSVAP